MDSFISATDSYASIASTLRSCGTQDQVKCDSEQVFALVKSILVKERIGGVTVTLVNKAGAPIRQVSSKKKAQAAALPEANKPKPLAASAPPPSSDAAEALTQRQLAVVSALEKVLMHCKREGLQLIGYSDALVALPSKLTDDEISAATAYEIDSFDCYRGADEIQPELDD